MRCLSRTSVILCLCLAGCGPRSKHVAKVYSGPALDASQIAIVKGGTYQQRYVARFGRSWNLEPGRRSGNIVDFGFSRSDFPLELHVLPGNYELDVDCYDDNRFASLPIRLRVEAGVTYEIRCSSEERAYNEAKAFVLRQYRSAVPSER